MSADTDIDTDTDTDTDTGLELRVELRVLYGPQAGSRLALAEGEYLLGTSDLCTIILTGPKIAQEHAILTLEGGQITIQPLDRELSDAAGNDFTDSMTLAPGQAIELGGIWITVDDPDAEWPDMQSIAPAPGALPAPNGDGTDDDDQDDAADAQAAQDERSAQAAAGNVVVGDSPAGAMVLAQGQGAAPRRNFLRMGIVGAALAFAVVAAVLVNWLMAEHNQERRASVVAAVTAPVLTQPKPVAPAAITAYLKILPYGKNLAVARDDSGDWIVTGAVRTNADKQELSAGLALLTPAATAHVTVDEELVAAANRFLAARTAGNAVIRAEAASGGGSLRLTGGAIDAATVETVMRELKGNVPGIRNIVSQVALPQQLRERLRERIGAARLDKRLAYVQEAPEVVLSGKLNSEETARWETLLVQFARDYGNIVPIRASIGNGNISVSDGIPTVRNQRLPVGVQAIVSGPVPYIVTNRGERINQGGEIDGQTLLSVRDGEVVFEGKRRIRLMR
ncbi:MAG: type III secretion system inner membrane ring subunit SctD [Janthinobacterium lividum]